MLEPSPNHAIIQDLIDYAGSRFCLIILAITQKGLQKGYEKRQEWMVKGLREELVSNFIVYLLKYFLMV